MADKYDEDLEFLLANPEYISDAWADPNYIQGGSLFGFCNKSRKSERQEIGSIGCLTMVAHSNYYVAETQELTDYIKSQKHRILSGRQIDSNAIREQLEVFVELNRYIDQKLNRS